MGGGRHNFNISFPLKKERIAGGGSKGSQRRLKKKVYIFLPGVSLLNLT